MANFYNKDKKNNGFNETIHREMISDFERNNCILKEITKLKNTDKFLEIGFGTGLFCIEASKLTDVVVGIDTNDTYNAKINEVNKNINLITGDFLSMEKIEGGYDLILSETLSTWGIEEDFVKISKKIYESNLLSENGRVSPSAILNFMELGHIESMHIDLSSIYLETTRKLKKFKPLTGSELVQTIDKDFIINTDLDKEIVVEKKFKNPNRFEINAIRLSSTTIFGVSNYLEGRDSLNPPIIIPIKPTSQEEISVKISFFFSGRENDIKYQIS